MSLSVSMLSHGEPVTVTVKKGATQTWVEISPRIPGTGLVVETFTLFASLEQIRTVAREMYEQANALIGDGESLDQIPLPPFTMEIGACDAR